jgi:hypothetical protein
MEAQIKEEIKKIIKRDSWFLLDDDDEDDESDYLMYTTRRHGNILREEPGIEDVQEGQRVLKLIKDRFWDVVKIELSITDEWVNLEITEK